MLKWWISNSCLSWAVSNPEHFQFHRHFIYNSFCKFYYTFVYTLFSALCIISWYFILLYITSQHNKICCPLSIYSSVKKVRNVSCNVVNNTVVYHVSLFRRFWTWANLRLQDTEDLTIALSISAKLFTSTDQTLSRLTMHTKLYAVHTQWSTLLYTRLLQFTRDYFTLYNGNHSTRCSGTTLKSVHFDRPFVQSFQLSRLYAMCSTCAL